jgi:polyisoprenyl-phosphate glycosyltransferase
MKPRHSAASGALRMSLAVVAPCYNEEEVLPLTYRRLTEVFGLERGIELALIFVDDGSTDRTGDILLELETSDPRVKVVTLSRNFGHQAAVSAGLAAADADAVAIIDCDLQDPPEVVLEMLERWREGYDVVYGVRTRRKESGLKKLAYAGFYRIFRRLASIEAPLDAGDFSLIDRSVLKAINALPERNRFFRGLRAWAGFEQIAHVYERSARPAGESKYSLPKLIKLALDGIFNFSTVPLHVVFYLGVSMALFSFCAMLFFFMIWLFDTTVFGKSMSQVQGFATTILAVLLIGGVQLISTGILGEYIGRIYSEVKGRPSFVVRERRAPALAEGSASLDREAAD